MRNSLASLALLLFPLGSAAQATSIEEPAPPGFIEEFARILGIHRAIGDLRTMAFADSALELRFWSIGWSMSGLRLRRTSNREWIAHRVIVIGPNSTRLDSVPLAVGSESQRMDSLWNELVGEGILTLPTHVKRSWTSNDGHMYIYELRRGQAYRAVAIEHLDRPEVPADAAIKRIARMLQTHFPFLGMPGR